jgi:hypothetical protein
MSGTAAKRRAPRYDLQSADSAKPSAAPDVPPFVQRLPLLVVARRGHLGSAPALDDTNHRPPSNAGLSRKASV